nr:hypothetical protein BaRGS_004674 [Batillaria attramentaria]
MIRVAEINLCEKLPNVEPNGEHLGRPGDKIIVYTNWTDLSQTNVNRCLMRFSTCDYCRLRVNVINNFDFRSCPSSAPAYIDDNGSCAPGCTYLHLYDQDYSNQTAKSFSNEALMDNYATESRFLYVIACSNKSMTANVLFNITVTSEDKAQVFKGSSIHRPGTFHSPFFPDAYVLNSEIYRFIFQAATQDEFVTISFDDWHLSSLSTIIFDDANVIGVIQGSALRPWIISNKYRLTMTFETGPYRIPGTFRMFTGFKATYSYHASAGSWSF